MTVAVANISLANTFGHWVNQTNQLADAMSTVVITIGGNNVGNAVLQGTFTATTLVANVISGSGNVRFTSATFVYDTTATLSIECGTTVKSSIQFDSVSNIKILGQNANTPLANFLAANPDGTLKFVQIAIPSTQLTDFATANAVLSNNSILIWNTTTAAWVAGDITSIPYTHIANLQVDVITSNVVITGTMSAGNTLFVQTSTGRVGVGTAAPRVAFDVNGVIYAVGDIRGFQTSDANLKTNVTDMNLAEVHAKNMQVRVVEFDWRDDVTSEYKAPDAVGHDEGVLAQQIQTVWPECVKQRPDGTLGVDYLKLVPKMLASIQHLSQRIENLEKR